MSLICYPGMFYKQYCSNELRCGPPPETLKHSHSCTKRARRIKHQQNFRPVFHPTELPRLAGELHFSCLWACKVFGKQILLITTHSKKLPESLTKLISNGLQSREMKSWLVLVVGSAIMEILKNTSIRAPSFLKTLYTMKT